MATIKSSGDLVVSLSSPSDLTSDEDAPVTFLTPLSTPFVPAYPPLPLLLSRPSVGLGREVAGGGGGAGGGGDAPHLFTAVGR